ncbi:MAG: hypothetical protein ACI3XL_03730 [Eubacteriales bacterium]
MAVDSKRARTVPILMFYYVVCVEKRGVEDVAPYDCCVRTAPKRVFYPAFSKAGAGGGARSPASLSAESETLIRHFFFVSFFLWAYDFKEKSG